MKNKIKLKKFYAKKSINFYKILAKKVETGKKKFKLAKKSKFFGKKIFPHLFNYFCLVLVLLEIKYFYNKLSKYIYIVNTYSLTLIKCLDFYLALRLRA